MANLLTRFNKTVVGSDSKLADYTSIITSSGDFKRIESIEVILNSWNNILLTPKRTYMFDPEYGSNLYKLVFEPADEKTKNQIIDETVNTIKHYDNRAIISNVGVSFFPNKKGFNLSIDVVYEGDRAELKIAVDEEKYLDFYESSS